jgi:hypothetical protein
MSSQISARILPLVGKAFVAGDARGRLGELVDLRAAAFEKMLPFKSAADVIRHKSAFLSTEHEQLQKFGRARVLEALGPLRKERTLVDALDVTLSFETWRRLRRDQKLSVLQAKRTLALIVDALLCC